MNNLVNFLLFAIISLSLATSSAFTESMCYKADRSDFNQTISFSGGDSQISVTPHDILFDLTELKKNGFIYLSFISLQPIPYADGKYAFHCWKEDPGKYQCSGDDDSGRMYLHIENGSLDVKVQFATMTNTPDDPIYHDIESKKNTFTGTNISICPKPHIFKNKKEKHLAFVCYSMKNKRIIDGKNKLFYHACARHNKPCETLKAKHFGKYSSDYESYNALARCDNSEPLPVPNTHSYLELPIQVEPIKSEKKKEKLLQTITVKDVSIYDIDYYKDLSIAVGEDDSPETRKLQLRDEHHESVILRSTDDGKSWRKIGTPNEYGVPYNNVIVLDKKRIIITSSIEGAGGSILLSSDTGDKWETRYDGGMIDHLKYIKGDTIIAEAFWGTVKSIDGGKNWVEYPKNN